MSEQPILSILLPTFNRAHYLRECLDSLLDNTIDCEIVIGDNASEDGTAELVASYQDPRIRYFRHEKNIGAGPNVNSLLDRARGKYVSVMCDDDKALPGNYELKVGLLEKHPKIDLVYSTVSIMDESGRVYPSSPVYGRAACSYIGGRDEFQELMLNYCAARQTVVFRRHILSDVGYPNNPLNLEVSGDWYWVQKMCRGRQAAFINKPLVCVRANSQSDTQSPDIPEGHFLTDRIAIWTHWLLENPEPPVVSNLLWERMATIIEADLDQVGADDDTRRHVIRTVESLKQAYLQRMEDSAMQELIDAYPFQPECPPWPLEGLKRRSIAWYPDWSGTAWRDVIQFYVESFRSDDPITLVIVPDMTHRDDLDRAVALVEVELQVMELADIPDILIVPEIQSDFDLACVYAAVDAVLVHGTSGQAPRAGSMQKDMIESLKREDWMPMPSPVIIERQRSNVINSSS